MSRNAALARANLLPSAAIFATKREHRTCATANLFTVFFTIFSLRNPLALTLFYTLLLVVGAVAASRMARSILPPIALPVVGISAAYPGAGPSEIERLLVQPMEQQIQTLPDVSRVSASAQTGIGAIVVQFRFGSNLESDRANVQNAVEAARADMPPDLVPPVVSKSDPTQAPVLEEAVSSVLMTPAQVAEVISRRILPKLRAVPGVGIAQSSGTRVRQFTIRPQTGALEALSATPLDVLRAVAGGNDLLPGGVSRSSLTETSIGIDASVRDASQIARLPVALPNATYARIADLARVSDGYADASVLTRVDGEEAAVLSVTAAAGADEEATIRGARHALAELALSYPFVRFQELRTNEPFTNAAIAGVAQTLGEGIVLTVLVMLFFLHAWRNALIAAIAIPTSLAAALIAMWMLGFNLNVLSLMGLSLTIGILVDDSIVIIEAIARAAARGLNGDEAALDGRRELGGAALTITLVDVAVFLPIGLMNGIVGEFMREFALVIVFATAFSLFVSFTLTPLLSARWALARVATPLDDLSYPDVLSALRQRTRSLPWTLRGGLCLRALAAWHAAVNAFNASERSLAQRYAQRWLPAAIAQPRIVVAIALFVCGASLVPLFAGWIAAEFSPPVSRGELRYTLAMPAGTPLAATDAAANAITQTMLDDAAVRHTESSAGRAFDGGTDRYASNVAQLDFVLEDPAAGEAEVDRRVRATASRMPAANLAGGGKGMGGVPAVSYDIGGDPNAIGLAAQRLASLLRTNPVAIDVRTGDLGAQPHLTVRVDDERARVLNVAPDDVAQTARIAGAGAIATKARLDAGLVDVVVQSGDENDPSLEALRRLPVRSLSGELVPLGDLTRIEPSRQPAILLRENGESVVSVTANAAGDAPISLLTAPVARALRDPSFLPPGAHVEPRGDIAQLLDTVTRMLGALGLSLVAVYVILAVLYRSYTLPLVVMMTVPLASVGAFGSLFLTRAPLNLYSMLGVVMLVGLVAKNGILLVEYAERAVRQGLPAAVAATRAAQTRFRPIVMTTFAMIAGMLPLALGHTAGAEYRRALGIVVIGGLSTSLLLTLFVVPVAFAWYREWLLHRDVLRVDDHAFGVDVTGLGYNAVDEEHRARLYI